MSYTIGVAQVKRGTGVWPKSRSGIFMRCRLTIELIFEEPTVDLEIRVMHDSQVNQGVFLVLIS